ncbi:hypothetical protein HNW77_06425 [Komagataeibacter sp. AV436]|uniref:Uncharacterized protein n=1 Tax=Komagataeibacter melomenusus TaxID=2766578 RepID=A0ABX2ACE9_9PROT|nr:hypothetical protein [Komagataeibacter melomenusus]MBV1830527.1 hypothetical protein [Komagataeibacter melomenusus]NPC66029.1 hypothetical protein [Komagataeibacter melomenusus]
MKKTEISIDTPLDDLATMKWSGWLSYPDATRIDQVVVRVRHIIGQEWAADGDLYEVYFNKCGDDGIDKILVAEIKDQGTTKAPVFYYRYRVKNI